MVVNGQCGSESTCTHPEAVNPAVMSKVKGLRPRKDDICSGSWWKRKLLLKRRTKKNLEVRMVILFFVISDFRPLEARAVRVFSNIYCYCFWGFLFTSFIYLQVLRLTSMFRILSAPERKVQRREIETAGGRNEIFFTVFWKHLRNFREYFCNDTITKSS